MSKVLVSIITPVFNAEKYIAATVESVLNQTLKDWELLLIIDKKCVDGSSEICQEYAKQDKRIRILNGDSVGVAQNRNLGLDCAAGEYICFLDADDIWLKEKLEVQYKYANHYSYNFVYSSFAIINHEGSFTHSIRLAKYPVNATDLLKNNCIGCSTVMIKKEIIGKVRFREGHHEDLDFWIRLLGDRSKAFPIREVLSLYRVFESSRSANKLKCASWRWELMVRHHINFFSRCWYMISYVFFAFWKRSLVAYARNYRPYSEVFSPYNEVNQNLVSVIMPAFNSEKTIAQSINSVLKQTYKEIELIIVDDFSSDRTVEIISSFNDSRLRLVKNVTNVGAAVARNYGIEMAKGRYISFLDADDVWLENKTASQVEFMKDQKCPLVYSAYNVIDPSGNIVGGFDPPQNVGYNDLLYGNVIGCLTAIYDRRYFGTAKFPLLRKRQDYALWLALLKRCSYARSVGERLANYRTGIQSLSSNKLKAASFQWTIYNKIEGYSLPLTLWYFLGYFIKGVFKHLYSYRAFKEIK
ncbi:MAG: glycosyltransferase family 2 protein [Bdellovibrionia bacterium]